MPRFLLTIQFDGAAYYGWQRQEPGRLAVQEVVENAIADLTGQPCVIHGASRTDRGVHARAMPAHADFETRLRGDELRRALDVRLPRDVALRAIEETAPDFHARFHAAGKCYAYRVHHSRARAPIGRGYTHHEPRLLNDDAMREGARALAGEHDFSSFATLLGELPERNSSPPDPAKPDKPDGNIRRLWPITITRQGELLTFYLFGSGFLRGMVRCLVGTLLDVGSGRTPPAEVAAILAARDRRRAGPNLPPEGLTLERVYYDEAALEHDLEAVQRGTWYPL